MYDRGRSTLRPHQNNIDEFRSRRYRFHRFEIVHRHDFDIDGFEKRIKQMEIRELVEKVLEK